jgi:hypothetical protein
MVTMSDIGGPDWKPKVLMILGIILLVLVVLYVVALFFKPL